MSSPGTPPARWRDRLLARKASLESSIHATEEDRRPVSLDQTRVGRLSRMDALQHQAMAQATQARRQLELRRIAAALERIEAGRYGACLRCGEPIPEARLSIDPCATLCAGCAEAPRSAAD